MSDHFLRLIPSEFGFVPTDAAQQQALVALRAALPAADKVAAHLHSSIAFVDAGSNFEGVFCSLCESDLTEVWFSWMNVAHGSEFRELGVTVPCCGTQTSLPQLEYRWPAGFSRFVLEAQNPGVDGFLPERVLSGIAAAAECPLRQIVAHY